MNYKDIVAFAEANPVCTLATCDNEQAGQPHVRAFLTNIIDDKIYFTTSLEKKVGRQILHNQHSELCYLAGDFSKMLRITTKLKIVDDKEIKQYLIDNREYLKHFSVDDPNFLLLTLSDSRATFWSLEDNLKENTLEVLSF